MATKLVGHNLKKGAKIIKRLGFAVNAENDSLIEAHQLPVFP
jgi:hypothetical protein